MTFLTELQRETNYTFTENWAKTNKTTLSPVLDYFALAGAMRNNPAESAKLFERAYIADKVLAVRALFYLRDIRGGQGERDVFFAGLERLRQIDPATYSAVLKFVPEYGRWADLFVNGISDEVVAIVSKQLDEDIINQGLGGKVSLLAKWLPSENTSSQETRTQARILAEALGYSPRDYRKTVVSLRKTISLLEQKMSANEWDEVDYSKVPSQAFRKHTKAFSRHDQERFSEFLTKAEAGEVNLNTSTLYTYEVFDAVQNGQLQAANAMWVNLPDWTNGKNAIVLADVSGSMMGRPMSISVSLALYFAERNVGAFNGYFLTFSANPQLVKVRGNTLAEKLNMIERSDWGWNTNIQAAFDAILSAAVKANASPEEVPSVLYVISDMEFDMATDRNDATNLEVAQEKFRRAGYELPHVVFWNVDARNTQVPATKFDHKVTLISGFSQANFRYAVEGKTPEQFMLDVLGGERYAQIVL